MDFSSTAVAARANAIDIMRLFGQHQNNFMALELTPALAIAWNRAGAFARGEGRGQVEPLDLLRGLLAEEEGHAAQSLVVAGLNLAKWAARFPEDAHGPNTDHSLPPAPALRLVMTRAGQESGRLTEEGSLSSDQVLAALLAVADGIEGALAACGFDVAQWKKERGSLNDSIPLDEPLDLTEPDDTAGALRIIDAAANRAREALRVLEDHARFVLDDAFLSRLCKELRHDLAEALAGVPSLLLSRDTLHDVGAAISTASERQRGSLHAVVRANAKRLQEALRSLEEYGKIFGTDVGEAIEKIRYRSYTLEKALALGTDARGQLADARLYALVSEASCRTSLLGTIRDLAEGGVDVVQLREKKLDDRALLSQARAVRELTSRLRVLLIVNDRPDIAVLCGADGVHLGQDDLPIREARRIVGPKMLIGVSSHDIAQVRQAVLEGASYIGVGPTFPSQTKDFASLAGLEFVKDAAAETSIPAFVLGGVTLDNLPQALAAGAKRIAVSHALCAADDPRQAAARFRAALRSVIPPHTNPTR
jgi:thiamine-phosphate pyrophosphorylase